MKTKLQKQKYQKGIKSGYAYEFLEDFYGLGEGQEVAVV